MAQAENGPGLVRRALHGLRLAGASFVGGLVAGAATGLAARLLMWVVRLTNASHNGEITHAGASVGQVTLEGTLGLMIQAMFVGVAGAPIYLLFRRWIPGRGWRKGLLFGVLLLVLAAPAVMVDDDYSYEYLRYASPRLTVPMFALLFPIYGVVMGLLTEWLGSGEQRPPSNRAVAAVGHLATLALAVVGVWTSWPALRDAFGLTSP